MKRKIDKREEDEMKSEDQSEIIAAMRISQYCTQCWEILNISKVCKNTCAWMHWLTSIPKV